MSTLLTGQRVVVVVDGPRGHLTRVGVLWAVTFALTGVGVVIGVAVPVLAPGGTPHATLHGSVEEASGILVHNLRVLAAPVILVAARWSEQRVTCLLGDVIVAAIVVGSPLMVGAALGRHGTDLLRYLPHVPLEWLALSIAAATWLTARVTGRLSARVLAAYATAIVLVAAVAASVETVAVPHIP